MKYYISFDTILDKLADQLRGEEASHATTDPRVYAECSATIHQITNRLVSVIETTHPVSRREVEQFHRKLKEKLRDNSSQNLAVVDDTADTR